MKKTHYNVTLLSRASPPIKVMISVPVEHARKFDLTEHLQRLLIDAQVILHDEIRKDYPNG